MNKLKLIITVFTGCLPALLLYGQDPSFSQFFSSPLNINPALTANINADWRAISNFRDQWIGPASPYVTGTVSYDRKMFNKRYVYEEEGNTFGLGTMLMYDHAMAGIVRSTYASLNLSYRMNLSSGDTKHRLTAGFGTIYGHRRIDYSRIDFEEQFTGYGFNTNLPTGETSLSRMKPYFSVTSGLVYSITTEKSNFDLGVSAFHVNKPRQTFLKDERQILPVRKVAHTNYERYLSESLVLNINAIYQRQRTAEYYSFGGALGYFLPTEQNTMINAGIWYWSRNAIVPYIGLVYGDMQFGFSYDVTVSKLNQATDKPNTWELSLIIRGKNKPSYEIPCPWK